MQENSVSVVVAKFNESIDWAHEIKTVCPQYELVIYDKSYDCEVDVINTPGLKVIGRDNIGREAETYLYHIVMNYDKLPDYTLFLQGNPFDHCRLPRNEFIKCVKEAPLRFRDLETHPWIVVNCDGFGHPNHPGLPIAPRFVELGIQEQVPDMFNFVVGAQFLVSRQEIQSRSREFYLDLHRRMHNNGLCAWTMERFWGYMFNLDIIKRTNIPTYP